MTKVLETSNIMDKSVFVKIIIYYLLIISDNRMADMFKYYLNSFSTKNK